MKKWPITAQRRALYNDLRSLWCPTWSIRQQGHANVLITVVKHEHVRPANEKVYLSPIVADGERMHSSESFSRVHIKNSTCSRGKHP